MQRSFDGSNRASAEGSKGNPVRIQKNGGRSPAKGAAVTGAMTAVWMMLQVVLPSTPALAQTRQESLSYSDLLERIENRQVKRLEIDSARGVARVELEGESADAVPQEVALFAGDRNTELIEAARDQGVAIDVQPTAGSNIVTSLMIHALLAFLLIMGLLMILRRSSNASGQAMNFG
ncbi:hypothetical protein H6G00_16780, partial [Leptolyngbya sp. FACHB-541]|nr:hypothetical protein [Leptolyngbya sp. FACHB-541]